MTGRGQATPHARFITREGVDRCAACGLSWPCTGRSAIPEPPMIRSAVTGGMVGRTATPVNVDDHIRDKDGNLRGYGYYLAFDYTGVEAVDRILAALHLASKAYHSTEGWSEEMSGRDDDYSYSDLIQQAANEAAESFREARDA